MTQTLAEMRATLGIVYCPTCQQDTMPDEKYGICFFCNTLLVDTGKALPKRQHLRGKPKTRWTPEMVCAELRKIHAKTGRTPFLTDSNALQKAAIKLYPSWQHALVAAGLFATVRDAHAEKQERQRVSALKASRRAAEKRMEVA